MLYQFCDTQMRAGRDVAATVVAASCPQVDVPGGELPNLLRFVPDFKALAGHDPAGRYLVTLELAAPPDR
jgi:hypothetical protein